MRVFLVPSLVLAAAIVTQGCNNSSSPSAPGEGPTSAANDHAEAGGHQEGHGHAEEGPHKGHLIELGKEEFHAELTHDETTSEVTIYLLDGAAKESVPVPEAEITVNIVADGKPMQFSLAAKPLETDPQGQSSRFTITAPVLHEALEAENSKGQLNVTINGKPYSGSIEHHEHADEKH